MRNAGPSNINDEATFSLNVARLRKILLNDSNYFGFLAKEDDNPGRVTFRSLEWSNGAFVPRLELVFDDDNDNGGGSNNPHRTSDTISQANVRLGVRNSVDVPRNLRIATRQSM